MPSLRMLRNRISIFKKEDKLGMVRSIASTPFATSVPALILAADLEASTTYGLTIGSGYKIYTNPADKIEVTNKISDETGRMFLVKGAVDYNVGAFGNLAYNRAYCELIGTVGDEV